MKELRYFLKSRAKVNLIIVLINIGVFSIMEIVGDTSSTEFMVKHGASYTPLILGNKEYYRLFTCMFLHFDIEHLGFNMLVLIFLGDTLEHHIGKIKYLFIYFLGGVGGNFLSLALEIRAGEFPVSAGASGAIFAVIGALVYIVLRNKGRLGDLSGRNLILMAGLSLFQGFTSVGVDNYAHLGGFISGMLLAFLLYRKNKTAIQVHRPAGSE